MKNPSRNINSEGSCVLPLVMNSGGASSAMDGIVLYLGQLMPVQVMPRIELKNEDIVDFGFCPDFAVENET
jgi:hypothetical protein